MFRLLPLLIPLALCGCWVDPDFEEYDLSTTPFGNQYIDRSEALLEISLAEGYTCPDGRLAQLYVLEPVQPVSPRPLAVLFHSRVFDYITADGSHYEDIDRLSSLWAGDQLRQTLGLEDPDVVGTVGGAWVAALLHQGFTVVAPTNCWGDLWHGRGQGDFAEEGFLRLGAHMADDAVRLGRTREGVSPDRLVAIGLGEGGRAITELILGGVQPDAVVIDSSPDLLTPLVSGATGNQNYVDGLLRVYDYEIDSEAGSTVQEDQLREALARDSMVHVVEDLGFRNPIVYGWSPQDEWTPVTTSQPAAEAISIHYPPSAFQVLDWQTTTHAPSNADFAQASELLDWLVTELGPLPDAPTE